MLGRWMKLPYRRDSIEKIVRDARAGAKRNLQLLGQLATSLGLHVIGAKVPASSNALQTPALIGFQGGFALAVANNANGLQPARARLGSSEPRSVGAGFPEGIDLLLLDRTNATSEQRFDFSWF